MCNMYFAPFFVATIYSKRPPCLNFAVYIVNIRSYMLPRRLRRLDALLIVRMISPLIFATKFLYRYRMPIYGIFVYKLSTYYKPTPVQSWCKEDCPWAYNAYYMVLDYYLSMKHCRVLAKPVVVYCFSPGVNEGEITSDFCEKPDYFV